MTLAEYITQHLSTPFAWGRHDCVLFAAGWVREHTGMDPLADVPAWSTEREALRAIRDVGGLEAALDARFRRIHPNVARDGDLALYNDAICIFSGCHIVGPNPAGLQFVNRMEAACAWSY